MVKVRFPGCRAVEDHGTYVVARGLLDAAQVAKADGYFNSAGVQQQVSDALVNETGKEAYKRRRSRVAFLDVREQPWLFKRLSGISKVRVSNRVGALPPQPVQSQLIHPGPCRPPTQPSSRCSSTGPATGWSSRGTTRCNTPSTTAAKAGTLGPGTSTRTRAGTTTRISASWRWC